MEDLSILVGRVVAQHESVNSQLKRIEGNIRLIVTRHDDTIERVRLLELDRAKVMGGWRVIAALGAVVGTLWVMGAHLMTKLWPVN